MKIMVGGSIFIFIQHGTLPGLLGNIDLPLIVTSLYRIKAKQYTMTIMLKSAGNMRKYVFCLTTYAHNASGNVRR
jgi:hypothetical protein